MRKENSDFDIISEIPQEVPGTSGVSTGGKSNSQTKILQKQSLETIPPKPSSDAIALQNDSHPEMTCLTCCCYYGRDETFSRPIDVAEKDHYCTAASKTLRIFLSSVPFYLYVLTATFLLSILLIAELLLALKVIVVPDQQTPSDNVSSELLQSQGFESRQEQVIFSVHWSNFSVLCLFFFEVLLRTFAWRLDLVKSIAAACDCAAVIVSFVVNVVTTPVAGYDSPFNAISLIIVFRFVRIVSLMEVAQRRVKKKYQDKLVTCESNTAVLQLSNKKLHREISERDYEIKQLRNHLGELDDGARQDLVEELKRKATQNHFDEEMERAIAISKQEYEEANGGGGGYSNPAFSDREQVEGFRVPEITIHHQGHSPRRDLTDVPSTSQIHPTSSGDIGVKRLDSKISHGELHAGAELINSTTPEDTALLLRDGGRNDERDHWTVGYCIIQQSAVDISSLPKPSSKKSMADDGSEHVDEGIGEESSSPSRSEYVLKQKKFANVNSPSADDTLSDQGCVSAASLCSESGYQSEDRSPSHVPLPGRSPVVPSEDPAILRGMQTCSRSSSPVMSGGDIVMTDIDKIVIEDDEEQREEDAL